MSSVFKAFQQAKRDRALATPSASAEADVSAGAAASPAPVRPSPPSSRLSDGPAAAEPQGIERHLVSLLDPISFAAEQYRTLRHIVEQPHRAEPLSVLAVSAPTIGDGKTTTAINLAGAFAQAADVRVLLVDADLRRPTVSSRLALDDSGPGLVDAILDPALGLGDVVRPRPPFNLWVLPAGPRTDSPYELLKSPRLAALLHEARQQYDYVILDTPPLVPVPDCRIIGKYVDGFLLVVAAHKTRAKLLDEALGVLGSSKILGLVFNGGDVTDSGYYYAGRYGARRGGDDPENAFRPWYRGGQPLDRLLRRRAGLKQQRVGRD